MRGRLVAAALELFAAHGYDGTTMDMIADRADVARTTVFNHFMRKDALLLAALADRRRVVGDRLTRTSRLPTDERIRDAVTGWARAYQTDTATGSALVRAWVQAGGPYLPDSTDTADLFADAVRLGQGRGDIRADIDPALTGLILLDVNIGTLIRWAADQPARRRSPLSPQMVRATQTVLLGLRA
jgi:TetR/AcrR family transcriptional regulator, cholesterol catabolism regulator